MTSATKNVLKVHLRHDQTLNDIDNHNFKDPTVTIFAPQWVREGLRSLAQYIRPETVLQLIDSRGRVDETTLGHELCLKDLMMISRNEPFNTSGMINFDLYWDIFADVPNDKQVIYAIKDLVRQCIIVGEDETNHYGGYGGRPTKQKAKVIMVDLIALQFQRNYNTGRLVLIGEVPNGLLDNLIFESVVGEKKITLDQVKNDNSGRYVKQNDGLYFDTEAYEKFVEEDFLLVSLALHHFLGPEVDKVNLKFLKYGTGFFAGGYARRVILDKHITRGVYRGLERLLSSGTNQIKSFEFPYFNEDKDIIQLCAKHSIKCRFTKEDALKQTDPSLVTATTNCADPHAMAGNEMGYQSVDAAIAENLKSKANKFSPIINNEMKEKFIDTNMTIDLG